MINPDILNARFNARNITPQLQRLSTGFYPERTLVTREQVLGRYKLLLQRAAFGSDSSMGTSQRSARNQHNLLPSVVFIPTQIP